MIKSQEKLQRLCEKQQENHEKQLNLLMEKLDFVIGHMNSDKKATEPREVK